MSGLFVYCALSEPGFERFWRVAGYVTSLNKEQNVQVSDTTKAL